VAPASGDTPAGRDTQVSESAKVEETKDYGKGYVFTLLVDATYEPYEYYDASGKLTGFDVELARAVCDYYGWEFSESTMSFDVALSKLRQGEGSCAWSGITKAPEREKLYLFSKPYVESHFTYDGEESVSEYAVAFRKEDTKLCELVNAAFDALSADGTVQKLADKYLKNTNDVLLL
jgi:ABC-type amino acid transport substrate-binding protein